MGCLNSADFPYFDSCIACHHGRSCKSLLYLREVVIRKPLTADLLAMKSGSREKVAKWIPFGLQGARELLRSLRILAGYTAKQPCTCIGGPRCADTDGKSLSHGVVAACRNLPAAHFSEVRGLPVVLECRPCVPGLVESYFRKETRVTEYAIWCIASHSRDQARRESFDCMA